MGNVSSDSLGVRYVCILYEVRRRTELEEILLKIPTSAGNPLFGGGLNFVTRIWCIEARREEDIEEESDRKWCKRKCFGQTQ